MLRAALRFGVRDVLAASSDGETVRSSVSRAIELATSLRGRLAAGPGGARPEAPGGRPGEIITVFSAKGGCGKTFLATNLAVALAAGGTEVALVDLDLHFGDVAIVLQLFPTRTIQDAARERGLDARTLRSYLTPHHAGVWALAAPTEPPVADTVSASAVSTLLKLLRSSFAYVVVDTPAAVTDQVLAAFDESDAIALLATLDVPSIKNLKLTMQTMERLRYPPSRIRVIVNRADSRVGLRLPDVEKVLGTSVDLTIPSPRPLPAIVGVGAGKEATAKVPNEWHFLVTLGVPFRRSSRSCRHALEVHYPAALPEVLVVVPRHVVLLTRDASLVVAVKALLDDEDRVSELESPEELPSVGELPVDAVVVDLPGPSRKASVERVRGRFSGPLVVLLGHGEDPAKARVAFRCNILTRPFGMSQLWSMLADSATEAVTEVIPAIRRDAHAPAQGPSGPPHERAAPPTAPEPPAQASGHHERVERPDRPTPPAPERPARVADQPALASERPARVADQPALAPERHSRPTERPPAAGPERPPAAAPQRPAAAAPGRPAAPVGERGAPSAPPARAERGPAPPRPCRDGRR